MSKKQELTEAVFKDWLQHPGTQALHLVLAIWREEVRDSLAEGLGLDDPLLASRILGSHDVCERLRTMDFNFLTGELGYERDVE